ncbi:hypothetical protein IWZ00DRAFT_9498 [Phyllosticta capitalensis]
MDRLFFIAIIDISRPFVAAFALLLLRRSCFSPLPDSLASRCAASAQKSAWSTAQKIRRLLSSSDFAGHRGQVIRSASKQIKRKKEKRASVSWL